MVVKIQTKEPVVVNTSRTSQVLVTTRYALIIDEFSTNLRHDKPSITVWYWYAFIDETIGENGEVIETVRKHYEPETPFCKERETIDALYEQIKGYIPQNIGNTNHDIMKYSIAGQIMLKDTLSFFNPNITINDIEIKLLG